MNGLHLPAPEGRGRYVITPMMLETLGQHDLEKVAAALTATARAKGLRIAREEGLDGSIVFTWRPMRWGVES